MNFFAVKNTGDILTAAEVNALSQMITAPTTPTLGVTAGQAGVLNLASAIVTTRTPDTVTWELIHNWTPSATTTAFTAFAITIPSGWSVGSVSVGSVTFAADGLARFSGLFNSLAFYLRNETVSIQKVTIVIELIKN